MTEVPTIIFGGLDEDSALVVSDAEAAELYRYTRHDYINPNTFPNLLKLLARIERKVKA